MRIVINNSLTIGVSELEYLYVDKTGVEYARPPKHPCISGVLDATEDSAEICDLLNQIDDITRIDVIVGQDDDSPIYRTYTGHYYLALCEETFLDNELMGPSATRIVINERLRANNYEEVE